MSTYAALEDDHRTQLHLGGSEAEGRTIRPGLRLVLLTKYLSS